jgi:hypothetical protein
MPFGKLRTGFDFARRAEFILSEGEGLSTNGTDGKSTTSVHPEPFAPFVLSVP